MRFDAKDSASEGSIPAAKERVQRIHELREKLIKQLEEASKV
jgi:hypothetical protein